MEKMARGFKQAIQMSKTVFRSFKDSQKDLDVVEKYKSKRAEVGNEQELMEQNKGKPFKEAKVDYRNPIELRWSEFSQKVLKFEAQIKQIENTFSLRLLKAYLLRLLRKVAGYCWMKSI